MTAKTILLEEHSATTKVLDAIANLIARRGPISYVKLDHVRTAVAFLERNLDNFHMQREEAYLYPALAAQDLGSRDGPLSIMVYKRDMARGVMRRMNDTLRDIGSGVPATDELRASARALIDIVRSRITLENLVLIPAIDLLLTEDTRRSLYKTLRGENPEAAFNQHNEMLAEAGRIAEHLEAPAATATMAGPRW